jgi:hypothetical protein
MLTLLIESKYPAALVVGGTAQLLLFHQNTGDTSTELLLLKSNTLQGLIIARYMFLSNQGTPPLLQQTVQPISKPVADMLLVNKGLESICCNQQGRPDDRSCHRRRSSQSRSVQLQDVEGMPRGGRDIAPDIAI